MILMASMQNALLESTKMRYIMRIASQGVAMTDEQKWYAWATYDAIGAVCAVAAFVYVWWVLAAESASRTRAPRRPPSETPWPLWRV